MRKNIAFLSILIAFTGFLGSAKAQNYVTIPDPNFLSALLEILPAEVFNETGEMNADHEAVASLWVLDVKNRDIQSLEGVQYFISLAYLDCSYNQLTELPELSQLLDVLNCENNQLTRFSALPPSLTFLVCNNNQLVELPSLPQLLTTLNCRNNYLVQMPEFSNNLTFLNASYNCLSIIPERPEWITAKDFTVSPNRIDCLVTGLAFESENQSGTYPNPVENVLYLGAVYDDVRVYDLGGLELGSYTNTDRIETANWSGGVYLIRLGERYARVVKR